MTNEQHPHRYGVARRLLAAFIGHQEPILPTVAPHGVPPMPDHSKAMGPPSESRAKRLKISTTDTSDLIPPNDKLLVFRALTGIDSVPTLNTLHHYHRTAPNVGIYTRVVQAEKFNAQRYRFFSILINTCLGVQIVVAASLTALGAASGPHSAVTAFGAINTIMAGILTYLKGSGLPDRLKHYQNEWRNIREYIEQRERELCLDGCGLDVQEEIQYIEYLYEGVKREIEATKGGGESRASMNHGQYNRRSFLPANARTQDASSRSPVTMPQHSNPLLHHLLRPLQRQTLPPHPGCSHLVDARLLKVIDTDPENGPAIVGFALWSLPTSPVGKTEIETLEDGFSPPWPESCDGEFCERFFGANHERQAEVMDVDILRTHPAARRRGVATMLVQWGLEKAKEDEVEVYLSSTEMGRPVYEKLGFEVRKTGETAGGHVQHSMVWAP
ncbi:hypothetical protein BDV29DRAFT_160763 [Aspergillus leporis]|uniref:N-acetyltransferase domain-containing protein n=1 Tax=Aspergillus leporis TaxID=41062 RepID=A0A5N5WSH2_9EURO|nr:hypothetical protein BDV29DRAFT_160763 [Aspergillus leporis]